jgi:small-conductance mechanosensitive channel
VTPASSAAAVQRVGLVFWTHLSAFADRHGGEAWTRDLVPGISRLQLVPVGALLLLALIVHLIVRWAAGRHVKRAQARAAQAGGSGADSQHVSLLRLSIHQARGPLLALVWLFASYVALWALLFRIGGAVIVLDALAWALWAGVVAIVFWLLYRAIGVLDVALRHWALLSASKWSQIIADVIIRGARLALPLAAVLLLVPTLRLPAAYHNLIQDLASLILIGGVGVILCRLAATTEEAISREYRIDVADNLTTRKIQTQVAVLRKVVVTIIGILTVACMLMVFPSVRHVGTSLIASAGLAGVILGFAAQKSLGNLIAGIQIAFTQPIRLDDVVVIQNEWGRIEEIALTYVVIKIWDWRRLVVPITYFIENPFANWTRTGAAIMETVFLYLDYTAPIDAMRQELDRILEHSTDWDRQVKGIQVTNATAQTIEVRILISARDSGAAFNLCCDVREKMIGFLQREHPRALPQYRVQTPPPAGPAP